jgi:mono/diheme cytochrome c family protein
VQYVRFEKSLSILIALAMIAATAELADAQDTGSTNVDFNKQIRPIFTRHCTACHGGVKQAAGFSFVRAELAMDSIEPGDADASYLFERVIEEDDENRMPPPEHGPRLSDDEVALLRAWIDQGAKWGKHWAYEIPQRSTVAELSDENWPIEPIDRFVLRQLDSGILNLPKTSDRCDGCVAFLLIWSDCRRR